MKIVVMKGVVVRNKGRVVVEYDTFVAVIPIIGAEVLDQLREFPIIFREQRVDDPQLCVIAYLADNYPVDVGVGVERDDKRKLGVEIESMRQSSSFNLLKS